jgi:hypothetical protein
MKFLTFFLLLSLQGSQASAQQTQAVPTSTQALLNGVKSSLSKDVIKSVLMIVCPKDHKKGTGFVITGGRIIVTNAHVIENCGATELTARSSVTTDPVQFTNVERDNNRDLVILCASKPLPFSLRLNGDDSPAVETDVETWGYPLRYEELAPLLSRGYVAGYKVTGPPETVGTVKHLIINGAFNPGNSGGPLIDRSTGKVIGVVVTKWTLWSPEIQEAIKGFKMSGGIVTSGRFSRMNAQGQTVSVTDQEVLADVLDEFYKTSQVMIGEAISVSELNAFLKEKEKMLSCSPEPPNSK